MRCGCSFWKIYEATRTVLTRLLTRSGHSVVVAGSVAEATALIDRDSFDVIVSDLGLPDGSGFDFMREVQRPIPAIALSGYGTEDDLRLTCETGFFAHLVKPVNIGELRAALATVPSERVPAQVTANG